MKTAQAEPPAAGTLALDGEMTIYKATANFQKLRDFLATNGDVRIDLSAVTEIDSSGLQLLLLARAEAESRGAFFEISAHSTPVDEVFKLLF